MVRMFFIFLSSDTATFELCSTLLDKLGEFLHACVIRVYPVEVDLFSCSIYIICHIIQRSGRVVNVLPVKRGDKIPSQFSKQAVSQFIINMFQVFNFGDQLGPLSNSGSATTSRRRDPILATLSATFSNSS